MLTGLHILLTYKCTFECDHCFVHSSPTAEGAFTVQQLRYVFEEAPKIESLKWIYFEGGEPFLYYPLMIEGIKMAKKLGYQVGIVSNSFFATTEDDAFVWLEPLSELGIGKLSLSDDPFHSPENSDHARNAAGAAEKLGIPYSVIRIDKPVSNPSEQDLVKGAPITGGTALFRGRAVDKLIDGLPRRQVDTLTGCPFEELVHPERVHLDPHGHVHICQGVSMGNMFKTPLSYLIENYRANDHPIIGPLIHGGPLQLAKAYHVEFDDGYVDECHFCYLTRRKLLNRFPQYLTPKQVYGEVEM